MPTDLAALVPGTTRVICPSGVRGTVIAISERLRRAPVLVQLDTGAAKAYGAEQLIIVIEERRQPYP